MSVPSFDPAAVAPAPAPAPDVQAPAAPPASLGMADLAALEAYSQSLEAPQGEPGTGVLPPDQEQPSAEAGLEAELQNQTPEEMLRLRQQIEDQNKEKEQLASRLSEYESVESQQLQNKFREDLIGAFEVSSPEEIADSFIDLSRKHRQLQDQLKGGVQAAQARGRFIGLLEATEAHDPSFGAKLDAMEKTFGLETVQAIVLQAEKQQDPIGFIRDRLKHISLPAEVEAAKAEAAKQAAQNLVAKGKAPEVAPNTGSMRGKSPAPALDIQALTQKNLGMSSAEELDAIEAALNS